MSDFEAADKDTMLLMFPNDGTISRRIRRWNIQHGFVVTYAVWGLVAALVLWWLK